MTYVVKGHAFLLLLPPVIDRVLQRVRQAERLAEAEEELRQAQEDLERRVEQRTAELAEVNRRLLVEIEERKLAPRIGPSNIWPSWPTWPGSAPSAR